MWVIGRGRVAGVGVGVGVRAQDDGGSSSTGVTAERRSWQAAHRARGEEQSVIIIGTCRGVSMGLAR